MCLWKSGENFVEWLLSHLYAASRKQTQSSGLATKALCVEPSRQPGFLILRNQMWTRIRILSNSVLLGSGGTYETIDLESLPLSALFQKAIGGKPVSCRESPGEPRKRL